MRRELDNIFHALSFPKLTIIHKYNAKVKTGKLGDENSIFRPIMLLWIITAMLNALQFQVFYISRIWGRCLKYCVF